MIYLVTLISNNSILYFFYVWPSQFYPVPSSRLATLIPISPRSRPCHAPPQGSAILPRVYVITQESVSRLTWIAQQESWPPSCYCKLITARSITENVGKMEFHIWTSSEIFNIVVLMVNDSISNTIVLEIPWYITKTSLNMSLSFLTWMSIERF